MKFQILSPPTDDGHAIDNIRTLNLKDDKTLEKAVDMIWNEFTRDLKTNYLDKEQTRTFLEALSVETSKKKKDKERMDFEETFKKYDLNSDGKIERSEMVTIIQE